MKAEQTTADRFREWNEDISVTVALTEKERHHLLNLVKGSAGNPDCGICQDLARKLVPNQSQSGDSR